MTDKGEREVALSGIFAVERCNPLLHSVMVGLDGIEPSFLPCESSVLPLYDRPKVGSTKLTRGFSALPLSYGPIKLGRWDSNPDLSI